MKQHLTETLQIILGVILASIGLKVFLLPNGFLDGGVTGLSIMLSKLYGFDISLVLVVASIPFVVLAWFTLNRRILFKSVPAILLLAMLIYFENFDPITDDKLLIAVFGGLFLGAGIGITIKNGAVLDGVEVLGVFINNKLGISIGKVILFFNFILFSLAAFVLSVEVAMYSILTFLVTAKVIDLLIEGFEDYVGLMVVTENVRELEANLIESIGAGLTIYKGSKGHGNRGVKQDSEIIHTVINRIDIRRTYNLIDKVDPKAFIIEFDVNNIKGGVFQKYLTKEGLKKTIKKMN